MQIIFDNLIATMVGALIFMILVAVNHRSQMTTVEASTFYALNSQSMNFVFTLQRDMQGMSSVETITEEDSTFTFFAQTDFADTTKQRIEYRRTRVGQRDTLDLYQIQRYVDGIFAGGSAGTLVDWEVVARNAQGGAILNTADARQVFVRFEATIPVERQVEVGNTEWESTFRPPLLQDTTL